MPRYTYRCEKCENIIETTHGMMEKLHDCVLCGGLDCLVRVPQKLMTKKEVKKKETGDLVVEAIEENRKILQNQKQDLLNEKWDLNNDD